MNAQFYEKWIKLSLWGQRGSLKVTRHNTVKLYTEQLQSVRTTEYIHWDIVMGLTVSNSFFKKNFSKYFKMYEYITCDVHNLKLHIENTFKQTAMYIF